MDDCPLRSRLWSTLGNAKRVQALPKAIAQRIRPRIQKLISAQGAATSLLSRFRQELSSLCLLMLSLILGHCAHSTSRSGAIAEWERDFRPSSQVVSYALSGLGLRPAHPVQDQKQFARAFRSLPTRLDEEGSFWMSDDSQWVAYFSPTEDQSDPHLYYDPSAVPAKSTQGPKSLPHWQPMGYGWRGMQQVIKLLEVASSKRLKLGPVVPRKSPIYVDPRAIIY